MSTLVRSVKAGLVPEPAIGSLPEPVSAGLRSRGTLLERLPGESAPAAAERLDTAVMALFRDTRDSLAFETLYRRTSAAVLDWLRRLLARDRRSVDPQEVLQDTFVNVYQYSSRFRDERPDSFRVWVRTIASNALRRASSQVPRRGADEIPSGAAEPAASRAEPELPLEGAEDRRELAWTWLLFLDHYARAYAELSTRDRTALALVEIERLSYAEAGARLAVGASNMKMIMFRARQRLLAKMDLSMAGREACSPRPLAARRLRAVG